ncbi:TIGR00341 family protein [Natroniella sulfidigena]|uniref:TIGR00341 family protein n=1 Tax=Natroniella sulfidigena TaxID=723921 RepID=UPI00200B73E5|nr:TIGR00341 family protein [Natroniella sulfidigena]MCK8816122.1 TIGR00341 family protein [Natroniella sulfidigena]
MMQIVHATFESGKGKEAVDLLKRLGIDIENYKLIESETGDLLILNLLYGNQDQLLDGLKERFNFSENTERSLIIFTPDTVIPRDKEKVKEYNYRASRETIVTYAKDNSKVDSQLLILAVVAAIIATLGLIIDNTAVIVGSMVIAPVFGPIIAIAVGIVLGDLKLSVQGLIAELVVVVVAVVIGALSGLVIPNVTINRALEVRMLPTLPDLLIAFAAGGAGAYSLVTNIKQQLVGVVIAAALIPVMATIGIGIALWSWPLFSGAILLLLANFFALLLAIVLTFYFKGLKPQFWYDLTAKKLIKKSLIILVISLLLLAVPLWVITYQQMVKEQPEDVVRQTYREHFKDQFESRLIKVEVGEERIELVFYSPHAKDKEDINSLAEQIQQQLERDYVIEFEVIPTQRFEVVTDSS